MMRCFTPDAVPCRLRARAWSAVTVLLLAVISPCLRAETEVPLWPNGAPGPLKHDHVETSEDHAETGRLDRWVGYVSNPTLTFFPATGPQATRALVIVVPGGGYRYVCIDKEGFEVARWLNSIGISAAVLKYRVLAPDAKRSPQTIEPIFVETERAVRLARSKASEWKIDANRIGVVGFSAGAVMCARLVLDADAGDPSAKDPVEQMSSRPNFVGFVYGALPPGKNLKVPSDCPPFFIAHAEDDPKAKVSDPKKLNDLLTKAGVSVEMHFYKQGGHGFGIQPKEGDVREWPEAFRQWLFKTIDAK